MSSDIRVCTLNCWGLKFIAKDRKQRIAAIASVLADSDYDVIALQELWVSADYAHVRSTLAKSLPHAKYFYSGALGSGLALFSRWPILATTVHPYSLNGSPIDVAGGDWFVGKAAVSILVEHPLLGQLQVFNTHLFAKGGETGPEHLRSHRLVNAYEIAKLVRHAAQLGRTVIAMGDFNSTPQSVPIKLIQEHTGLQDAWLLTHPSDQGYSNNGPEHAIQVHGITADSPLNSYSDPNPKSEYVRQRQGKRLDYIFYRGPLQTHGHPSPSPEMQPLSPPASGGFSRATLTCTETKVALTERVPGRSHSYSDHFALEATFRVTPASTLDPTIAKSAFTASWPSSEDDRAVTSPDVWNGQRGNPPVPMLSKESIDVTIHALTTAYRHSLSTHRFYLVVFTCCIGLLVCIAIGTAWLPHSWINPIFILLTVVLSWLGTTMLYVGFVYGRWEVNALMNVVEELEIVRSGISGP